MSITPVGLILVIAAAIFSGRSDTLAIICLALALIFEILVASYRVNIQAERERSQ